MLFEIIYITFEHFEIDVAENFELFLSLTELTPLIKILIKFISLYPKKKEELSVTERRKMLIRTLIKFWRGPTQSFPFCLSHSS